jgi:DNA topoisomerase-1
VGIGLFGPYVKHKSKFYSLKKDIDDPMTISLDRAIELIEDKRQLERNKLILKFDEMPGLEVLNGRYGPYITYEKNNYKIPRGSKPEELTLEDCKAIIENAGKKQGKKKK